VGNQNGLDDAKLALYELVRARIRLRRASTPVALSVQARLGLPEPRKGLSIQDLLNAHPADA
jgi:hypothetical protein